MPCFIKVDMHHTWLCIMPCLCDGCLLCCLLLSELLLSLALVSFRSCEDPFDYVRLSSSWTRSSSLRDLRQDDHTLEITSIFALLVVYSIAMLRYLPLAISCLPYCHEPLTFDTFPMKTTVWLCYRFCSAPLIALLVAGEVEVCSMLEHGYVGISLYLLF